MKKVNRYDFRNNCGGKRGCSVNYVLPTDIKPKSILMEVHGIRNDIKKILPTSYLLLDKVT